MKMESIMGYVLPGNKLLCLDFLTSFHYDG